MKRGKISLGEELGLSAPLCYHDSQQRGVEEGAGQRFFHRSVRNWMRQSHSMRFSNFVKIISAVKSAPGALKSEWKWQRWMNVQVALPFAKQIRQVNRITRTRGVNLSAPYTKQRGHWGGWTRLLTSFLRVHALAPWPTGLQFYSWLKFIADI